MMGNRKSLSLHRRGILLTSILVVSICAGVAKAEEDATGVNDLAKSSDAFFILIGAVMILAMHGGFAFLEVGSVRRKNQVNALNKIICEWGFSTLAYFLIGYPIAWGVAERAKFWTNALAGGIFVMPLEECLRIRTDEVGQAAIG